MNLGREILSSQIQWKLRKLSIKIIKEIEEEETYCDICMDVEFLATATNKSTS